MYLQENPIVHHLPPNTVDQDAEVANRVLLITGLRASCVLHRHQADQLVTLQQEAQIPVISRPLQAPFGHYVPLKAGQTNIVAVHLQYSGTLEAFGPFSSQEDAYDYFPGHSSPHDTTISVFEVFASVPSRN